MEKNKEIVNCKKRRKIKRKVVYPLIVILSLIISVSFLLIDYNINNEEKILWGKSTSDFVVNYKVYNKDNVFYNEDYMNDYGSYVTSITDKIDFDIIYNFNTTKNLDISYTYDIDGQILAEVYENGSTSPDKKKEVDLGEDTKKNIGNANSLQLQKNISIPFKEYNDMMIAYKNNYNLNVTSYVKIILKVDIKSLENINSNLSNQDVLEIKIPLLQPTFSVQLNKKFVNNRDIYVLTKKVENHMFLNIGVIGIMFTIVLSCILLILYINKRSKLEIYRNKVNNILKKYEEIIIKVDTLPNISDLEMIPIKDFNDLIDLEET